jgi:hypothetical protein
VDNILIQDYLAHYGTLHKSGRYPWGSGGDEDSYSRRQSFLDMVDKLKKQGLAETDIAKGLGMNTASLRLAKSIAKNEQKQDDIHQAQKLKEKGMSNVEIGKRMGKNESQIRALLQPAEESKTKVLDTVSDTLRRAVDDKGYIDVGVGVEYHLGITNTKLRTAVRKLQLEGYELHTIKIEQLGTGQQTILKVLAKPGTTRGDVMRNRAKISQVRDYSVDGGETMLGILPPLSISSSRVGIRYKKDGGADADGVIYVRRGVSDVSLGKSQYAQVRIMVDGTHYIKGMAIYKDDLPKGVDLQFNTNKDDTGHKLDALKKIKDDPDNPFGSTVRQIGEINPSTGRLHKLTSVMNIVNESADWEKWSKNLSSQVLSKQRPLLAKQQLEITYERKKSELEGILRLNNASVRRRLLEAYADGVDSSAVHLKAAHLPRQRTQVILPVNSMKPTEVYAPNFKNGERVVLIRFPHGGTFEIPELTVNNNHPEAKKLLGSSTAAIGIHSKVAERLSGADFDGDTVLVIPNNKRKIETSRPLEGLEGFDPKTQYRGYPGMKVMTDHEKGMQMGLVSNLITDMTIGGANREELTRAVKHSMVVIDAEKHELDWKRSAQDNGISALMRTYQRSSQGGATTLISKARSPEKVNERKQGYKIDPATGKKIYTETKRGWVDADGKFHPRTQNSTKLGEADNAHTLSSGTLIEKVYADHSNKLKSLGNQARKELLNTKNDSYSPSAREAYRKEVASLDSKLALAVANAPLERQAQVIANATVVLKIQSDPGLRTKERKAELKKIKSQALKAARQRTGAEKEKFDITEKEWEAIQARAITAHKLDQLLDHADLERIKELATPRVEIKMSPAKTSKARTLIDAGYSWAEVADTLGVSVSTVQRALSGTGEGD